MISIASSAVTLLQLIIVCYIPSKGVYALTHLTSRSLSSPCRGAVSTPLSSAVFTFLTSLNSRRGHGDENFNYRISSVVTESAALKADSYRALHHSTYVGYVVGENRVQAVENGNVARSKSGYVEFQGKSRFQRVSATRACSRQRSDHKAHSVSRLYSSAVEDVIAQNREAKAVKSLDDDQPIILFHSVICGSSGAISSSGGTVSHNGQEVKPLKKTPIIVLHGLLGSARNFQSWMKLLQQREVELVREDEEKREQETSEEGARDKVLSNSMTRDVICMDLRNHGRTGVHYGSLKMDFELMARDVMHTIHALGYSSVHLVGHSLGGKVAAMAALEQADQDAHGSIRRKEESTIKILSLTMIDVSPVDYAEDESFAEVFRTLDIVDELHTHLPLVGKSVQPSEDSDGSSRSEDIVSRGLNTRVVLSDLVGERVSDPMLKAFLLANIQPKESVKEGVRNPGIGGLDDNIKTIMKRIASSREKIRSQHRVGFSSVSESESESENSSDKSETPEGFEWKFSVPGIVDFKSQLGGWPSVVPRQQYGEGDGDKGMEETDYIGTTVPLLGDKNDFKSSSLPQPFINPVLIMKGANSRFVRSSHISSISSMFPLFTLMTVRDAGHWLHFEKPKESSDSLIKFIRTVEDRVT